MVREIKLYVEGGGRGTNKNATIKLQQGFDAFLRELKDAARAKKISFRVIPSGSTTDTYEEFIFSVENSPQSFNLLLVDSDETVAKDESACAFLQRKYKKWKLQTINDEQCHLMVQIMESWFVADVDALKDFYGQDFRESAIPKNQKNVEKIDKARVESALKAATAKIKNGVYHKIRDGAKILEKINPQKVRASAPHCDKLFKTISEKIEG